MINFFKSLMSSKNGSLSSKRFVGILCVISLIVSLMVSVFTNKKMCPDATLVNTIGLLAFGALGLTSTEAIFRKKEDKEENQDS
jgi:hypothetical protein